MEKKVVSKDHFISLIDAIDKVRQKDEFFSHLLSYYMGSHVVVNSHDEFIDKVIEFAESLFCQCGKIDYFVKELDFGRVQKPGVKNYTDAGELYDELTN